MKFFVCGSPLAKFLSRVGPSAGAFALASLLAATTFAQTQTNSQGASSAPGSASSGAPSGSAQSGQTGSSSSAGKPSASASGNKKMTVNFEDQLIEGRAQKPELFYLLQQRNANFKRLIKLRENFLPEMRKTAEDVSRKGSGT